MAEQQELSIEQRIEQAIIPPTPEQVQENAPAAQEPQPVEQNVQETAEEVPVEATEQASVESDAELLPTDSDEQLQGAETKNEESESYQLTSLNDLATQIGVEPSDIYNLTMPVTDQNTGERIEVTLGEYKDGFTALQRAQKAEEQAQLAKAELEAQRNKLATEYQKSSEQTAQYLNMAEQMLLNEFNGVNWEQLKATDPNKYLLVRQDLQEKQNAINNIRNKAAQDYENRAQQVKKDREQQLQELYQREQMNLHRALPELANEKTKAETAKNISEYLLTIGFTPEEINSVSDHRVLVLAHKASKFDAIKNTGETAKKKVAKIGNKKILQPGAKQSKKQQQNDQTQKLRARLKKTGNHRDAVELISQRLRGKK